MRQDAIDAIDAIKPYKGGNDTLWQLHRLNVVDKHRLLVTVGSSFQSLDIGPTLSRGLRALIPDEPDAEPDEHQQIRFAVVINEPGVLEGEVIVETLRQMVDLVDHVVLVFRPLL